MRILYYETSAHPPVSPLFIESLEAHRYEYAFVDEAKFVDGRALLRRIAGRLLAHPLGYHRLNREMVSEARRFRPDLVFVGKGAYISPQTLTAIKHETGAIMVNYASDDPFNRTSHANTTEMLESIPLYDLYASTKLAALPDLRRSGCRNAMYVRFGYKPSVHFPERTNGDGRLDSDCDVVFIGGCDADRSPIFETLAGSIPNLRLHLYGAYWNRHSSLRGYWRGSAWGEVYRRALGRSKIAINLVRRANRDDHVMRTFEIPACGGFMLAERTDTHLELFEEGREAAYFSSTQELVDKVRYYLVHDSERRRIAGAGYQKVLNGRHTYDDRLTEIMNAAQALL